MSNHNFSSTCDHILNGLSLDTLQSLAVGHHVFVSLSDSPCIILDDDDEPEDWVHSAVSFYKFSKFNPNAQVHISIRKQPGIDTGGIRCQFFYIVFRELATSESFSLFEGPPNRGQHLGRLVCPAVCWLLLEL